MRIVVVVVSLVVVLAWIPDGAEGVPGQHAQYAVPFRPKELHKLEEAIGLVVGEADFLKQRLYMLGMQKAALLGRLENIQQNITDIVNNNTEQTARLEGFRDTIKANLHTLSDLEGRVAREFAIAQRVSETLALNFNVLGTLQSSNSRQTAALAGLSEQLDLTVEKLHDKLDAANDTSANEATAVQQGLLDLATLVDTKKCFSGEIEVTIDPELGTGNDSVLFPDDYFHGRTPTVTCGICSLNATINLNTTPKLHHGQTQYGYAYSYSPVDERQSFSVDVECKAFEHHVDVHVIDFSRGEGNAHSSVSVSVKACTYSAVDV